MKSTRNFEKPITYLIRGLSVSSKREEQSDGMAPIVLMLRESKDCGGRVASLQEQGVIAITVVRTWSTSTGGYVVPILRISRPTVDIGTGRLL